MRVIATRSGQYQGHIIEKGEVFVIEDEFFADAKHADPNLARFGWMERVADNPIKTEKKSTDQRTEPRDEGEGEQHVAEKKGWA